VPIDKQTTEPTQVQFVDHMPIYTPPVFTSCPDGYTGYDKSGKKWVSTLHQQTEGDICRKDSGD
jgi:hypothetical protein